jgi:hypothetical protein
MSTPERPDRFQQAFDGPVVPATPMRFKDAWLDHMMSARYERIGAGWFLGRMFYLFGDDLKRLEPCVHAWSFLLPPSLTQWAVIGFNAYGCILVLDEEGGYGTTSPVGMLDPLTVTYVTDPTLDIYSLLNDWLPNRKLEHFLDTSVYQKFLEASGSFLGDDEILGIRVALSLGGEMDLKNFSQLPIIDYYQATGPTYASAHKRVTAGQST